ncbi:F-type H+-transporting ATPase subunit gamma [Lachnospiraceae bacterium NK3A20]|nr:F-type H+-transporting ATPase subunit gamma [Lachnospiraceae bacterium NK3A20]
MAQTKEIKERISSIQNTMKITNAMYMISSTKLNNARTALAHTEPYFYALEAMFARVLRHLPADFHHPFLDRRETLTQEQVRRAIICVTADKGLAGAYNHNVIRMAEKRLRPDYNDRLFVVGEVGRDYFDRHGINVDEQFHYTAQKPTLARARQIASRMLELFASKEIDEVYIIFTRMKNSMENEPQVVQLLPLVRLQNPRINEQLAAAHQEEFKMEPSPEVLLDHIVPDFVSGYVYSALVESYCAEHSSRMEAMDSANKNGQQLLQELSLMFNRERQAAITQEITEVAAGAKARNEQKKRAAARRAARTAQRK